jgi:hypothetical protein
LIKWNLLVFDLSLSQCVLDNVVLKHDALYLRATSTIR